MKSNLDIRQASNCLLRREGDLMTRAEGFTDWIILGEGDRLLKGPPNVMYEGELTANLGLTGQDVIANDWIIGNF